ncbi:MAG: hypothetical protein HY092_01265 [Candidatus Kerfeldbacteria bacterium]|nr:hypothetical protein [Candidatus Kerfeldbacteria bacterium]
MFFNSKIMLVVIVFLLLGLILMLPHPSKSADWLTVPVGIVITDGSGHPINGRVSIVVHRIGSRILEPGEVVRVSGVANNGTMAGRTTLCLDGKTTAIVKLCLRQ